MSDAGSLAEAFLDSSPACHWIVDARGVILRVYGEQATLFGRPAADLVGCPPQQYMDAESAGAWLSRYARAFQGETVRLRENWSGTAWHISVFPVREGGEVRFAGGVAREAAAWATAERELRHTVLGALRAMEFSRNTAARFLHDSVGQNLTALGLQLDLIRMDLKDPPPEISTRLTELQALLETMMEDVREYSYELNPSTVERAGLRSALDRLVVRIRGRFAGTIRINVDPSVKLDPKMASAMYQIAHEAIENALQHASCSAIEIAVKSTRTGMFLEVRDNGKGFDPADVESGRRGLGLLSMEHYAAEAGLDLSIASNREYGTVIRASS
jgi:two-component system NarL family sensor kinase